jgi:hypothetical protein
VMWWCADDARGVLRAACADDDVKDWQQSHVEHILPLSVGPHHPHARLAHTAAPTAAAAPRQQVPLHLIGGGAHRASSTPTPSVGAALRRCGAVAVAACVSEGCGVCGVTCDV